MRGPAALLVLLLLAPALRAQTPPTLELGAGPVVPVGDFAMSYGVGAHARVGVRLAPASLPFQIRADGELHTLPEEFVDGRSALLVGSLSLVRDIVRLGPITADGRLELLLGAGYYALDTSVGGADGDLGVHSAVGLPRRVLGLMFRLEARLVHVFAAPGGYRLLPLTLGLRF